GGNKYSFQGLFDKSVEAIIFEYPGRGKRIKEQLLNDIGLLIEDLYPKVTAHIGNDTDYYVYGHSLGGIVAYLICKKLMKDPTVRKPEKLIVTGSKPPSLTVRPFSDLPGELFWNKLDSLGGMPAAITGEKDLMDFYDPILRSDVKLFEGYCHQYGQDISIPIDVFYGSEEEIAAQQIKLWADETSAEVTITKLEGNHFFILNHADYFRSYFTQLQLDSAT
ncbi:MAG: thioesterase domain-containing protein, partial [Cyclobacteriaceae bacterium]